MALFHSLAEMPVASMTSALLAPSPLEPIASLTLVRSSASTTAEERPDEDAPFVADLGRAEAARFRVPLTREAFFLATRPVAGAGASSKLLRASLTAAEVRPLTSLATSDSTTFRGCHLPSESSYQKTSSRPCARGLAMARGYHRCAYHLFFGQTKA